MVHKSERCEGCASLQRVERNKAEKGVGDRGRAVQEEGGDRVRLKVFRREKWGSVMRESQCLETDLNLRSDLMGRRRRSSDRRSSLEATMWADDSWLEDSSRVLILILILTLLTESILLGFVRMGGGSELLYAFCQASLVIWEVSMLRIEKCA